MQHEQHDQIDAEPHVFDQTNGLVDRGETPPEGSESDRAALRRRTVGGIAMLAANRPAG